MNKTYINGPLINEHVFNDGGSILKFSIAADKVDEFAAQLKSAAQDGWVRLVVQKSRSPQLSKKTGKVIATHNMSVDTWKPGLQGAGPAIPQRQQAAPAGARIAKPAADDQDSVPF